MILFDGIIFNIQDSGGVSVVFKEIISRLPQNSYLLLGGKKANPLSIEDDNYIHKRPRFLERLRRVKYGNHFDLFHSTYYRLPAEKSSKIVTTVHDYTYDYFSSGIRKATRSYIMNKAFSESDKIICVSENTREDLINFSGSSYEDRAVVIHNGVSDDYYIIPEIVVGSTKAPTLAIKAAFPASNKFCTAGKLGCKPNSIPDTFVGVIGSNSF